MEIPKQLKNNGIRFVLLEKGGKRPFQKDWTNKIIRFDSPELLEHLNNGGNYGVMGGSIDNNGTSLILVDFDSLDIQEKAMKFLPETFTVKTGSGMYHLYYFSNGIASFKGFDDDMNTLFDVQGEGKQVVAPGSLHPNGNYYIVEKDIEIQNIDYAELKAILSPFDKKPSKKEERKIEKYTSEHDDTFLDDLKNRVSVPDVLNWIGIDTSKSPTQCPFHDSKGGKCLGFQQETCHCFHCDGSWNIFSLIKEYKKCDFKEALEILVDIGGMRKEYEESKKRYIEKKKEENRNEKREIKIKYIECISSKPKEWEKATTILIDYINSKTHIYVTKNDEKSEFWIYKNGIYIPNGRCEIRELLSDLLEEFYNEYISNLVIKKIEPTKYINQDDFFNVNYRDEIPVENGILNVLTLELKPFDPKKIFFSKIPIKFDATKFCTKIDKFLHDVFGSEDNVRVFEELAGFCLLKEYKFEIAIMLTGLGRNGKTKVIELLKRLVGMENCCSVPLNSLNSESFSISELFGKMLNIVGDISNEDLKETSTFKHLTGRDLISGKRKFLRDITFVNYAKFVFACNELPLVYDMSRGFWDRWILLEFPYTFVTKEEYEASEDKTLLKIRDEDIINKITTPDEMSGFLNLALIGLHRLLSNHKFSYAMGCEDTKSRWIRKSNSFTAFCYDFIEEGEGEDYILKKELRKRYSSYCKLHKVSSKSDFVIKKVLQEMFGSTEETRNSESRFDYVWLGLKWKVPQTKIESPTSPTESKDFSGSNEKLEDLGGFSNHIDTIITLPRSQKGGKSYNLENDDKLNELSTEIIKIDGIKKEESPSSPTNYKDEIKRTFEELSDDLDSNYVYDGEVGGKRSPLPSSPEDRRLGNSKKEGGRG